MLAGAERQAAAGGEIELARIAGDLGKHGGEPAAAEPFLEDPERIDGAGHPDEDEAGRRKAEAPETGGIGHSRVVCCSGLHDPEDRAGIVMAQAREKRGGKPGGRGDIAAFAAADLMERGTAETAAEGAIDPRNREGNDSGTTIPAIFFLAAAPGRMRGRRKDDCFRGAPFDFGDAAAQAANIRLRHENACAHGLFPE